MDWANMFYKGISTSDFSQIITPLSSLIDGSVASPTILNTYMPVRSRSAEVKLREPPAASESNVSQSQCVFVRENTSFTEATFFLFTSYIGK